jgi:hypothetical protein
MKYYATADGSHGWVGKGVVFFDYPMTGAIEDSDLVAINEFLDDGRIISLCSYLDILEIPYKLIQQEN